jgi:lipocalin
VYANALVQYTFELGGKCVTADYGLLNNGVSVHNAQNMWKVNGTISTIEGRAFAPNASEPGQLRVEFDAVPFPGSYWIVKLGPMENGHYQYSVVTDAYALTLFILVRNVCVRACACVCLKACVHRAHHHASISICKTCVMCV